MGGALNVASRAATHATPHQILITAAARTEIGVLSQVTFTPLGARRLKRLAEELELFEVCSDHGRSGKRVRDPICGIEMVPTDVAARLVVKGRELAFCCERCLRVFLTVPERYGAVGEV